MTRCRIPEDHSPMSNILSSRQEIFLLLWDQNIHSVTPETIVGHLSKGDECGQFYSILSF